VLVSATRRNNLFQQKETKITKVFLVSQNHDASRALGTNLLVRKPWNVCAPGGVLHSNPENIAVPINVQKSILV
jgi:hypothetical protein